MHYEFVISVTAARTLSTAQYYSRPLCTTKKELLLAAKSASPFLTVLFKCTTLCCKVLLQNCYTIESRRLRVCWSNAQSDAKRYPKRCPNMSYVTTGPMSNTNKRRSSGPQQEQQRNSTTKYYSSTTPYYKVLLLQYYSSTTPYYKVLLLQYYSVLQSTTPVLLQYYKVLLQYYKVLLQYYKVLLQYYKVLLRHMKDCERSCIQHKWTIPPIP